jgi:hypothetical protein
MEQRERGARIGILQQRLAKRDPHPRVPATASQFRYSSGREGNPHPHGKIEQRRSVPWIFTSEPEESGATARAFRVCGWIRLPEREDLVVFFGSGMDERNINRGDGGGGR